MNSPQVMYAVLKFALGILKEHHLIKNLQTKHKVGLYKALKMAMLTARKDHEDVKKKGPSAMADDTNSMLDE